MIVNWAYSTEFFPESANCHDLGDVLKSMKVPHFEAKFDKPTRKYNKVIFNEKELVVLYGPLEFIKQQNTDNATWFPGPYGVKKRCKYSYYTSYLPNFWFLNNRGYLTTYGALRNKTYCGKYWWTSDVYYNELFIRPDSGFKSFAGQIVKLDDQSISIFEQTVNPDREEMIFIAPPVYDIQSEYRCFIVDKKVVGMSQYMIDGKPVLSRFIPDFALNLAKDVANFDWQLDVAYTADIAMVNDRPKIIELNSFCSSAFYDCNKPAIISAINAAAVKEYMGEL